MFKSLVPLLGASAIHIVRQRRQIQKLQNDILVYRVIVAKQAEFCTYLSTVLDKHDVEVTDFDLIVAENYLRELKELVGSK